MALYPIWKDYYVDLGTAQQVDYTVGVTLGGTLQTVYSGRAQLRPGATENTVRINDICASWLAETLWSLSDTDIQSQTFPLTFTTSWTENGAAKTDEVTFIRDWSYDYSRDYGSSPSLSYPVLLSVAPGMPLLFSGPAGQGLPSALVTLTEAPQAVFDFSTVEALAALNPPVTVEAGGSTTLNSPVLTDSQGSDSATLYFGQVSATADTDGSARIATSQSFRISTNGYLLTSVSFVLDGQTAEDVIGAGPGYTVSGNTLTISNRTSVTLNLTGIISIKSISVTLPVTETVTFQSGIAAFPSTELGRAVALSGAGVLTVAQGYSSIAVGGVVFTVQDSCAQYALYYVNAYGGWDCLQMTGNTLRTDSLTRHQAERSYDNRDRTAAGTSDNVIEIAPQWTLRTGWMTDAQSLKMHHLLNSPQVYLYDIADGGFSPVVLTNTSTEHKTYRNQGATLVSYEVTASLAAQRIRM